MATYKRIINKYTGMSQLVLDETTLNTLKFKAGVADVASLPSSGNLTNDARIVNDTHKLYIWDGATWQLQGDIIDIDWSIITNKPSASIADINDAVTKKHTQNSDTILDASGVNEISAERLVEASIIYPIGDSINEITTGAKDFIEIPFNCTIVEVTILAKPDTGGDIQIDIWKCSYSTFDGGATHPVDGDSICGGNEPIISSGVKYKDTTLTDWTKTLLKGDIILPYVDSITDLTLCTLSLKVKRT